VVFYNIFIISNVNVETAARIRADNQQRLVQDAHFFALKKYFNMTRESSALAIVNNGASRGADSRVLSKPP